VTLRLTTDELRKRAEARWLESWLEGPTRTRATKVPPQIGDNAPDAKLADTTGRARNLSEFWSDGPLLLLFLRHFGCSCLAERWEKLQNEVQSFRDAGAHIVAVAQGEPERNSEVAKRRRYPFEILSDPSRSLYEKYGLLEGTPAQILHDFAWVPGDNQTGSKMMDSRRGSERSVVDSPWQLPGEFVVSKKGVLFLTHRYQYCEDFPPKTVILGAIQAAKA
jgi:peroxiredoxin